MKAHKVKQGEDMVSVAAQYGFSDWNAVYNHSANQRLKTMRPDPMCLAPDDIVYIPDGEPIVFKLASNQVHDITVDVPKRKFHVEFMNIDGDPFANTACSVSFAGQEFEETTDAQGGIEKDIPLDAETVDVILKPEDDDEIPYTFEVSHLDPVEEVSGVQARLHNLGYYDADVDGEFLTKSSDAIRRFQEDYGLEPTGSLDEATVSKITEVYES